MSSWYARVVNGTVTGIETDAYTADMAAMSWVDGDMETGLSWLDADPAVRGTTRRFELRPITDQQAASWRAHRTLNFEGDDPCDA